jgi:hypothetical protein
MKQTLKKVFKVLVLFGINPRKFVRSVSSIPWYLGDLAELKKQMRDKTEFVFATNRPILGEKWASAGTMSGHYFHQDLLIARKIFQSNPARHVDIGSRTDGFVSHVAVFRQIEIFDIRPQVSKVKNIVFKQADLMQVPADMENYCDSASALHSLEHFGLGRYGDPIDYYGYLKGINSITKILKPGGTFYFSVPIGKQRIEFNAHRVFSLAYLLQLFNERYELKSFSYVNDKGELFEDHKLTAGEIGNNLRCHYGCGIFEWIKK